MHIHLHSRVFFYLGLLFCTCSSTCSLLCQRQGQQQMNIVLFFCVCLRMHRAKTMPSPQNMFNCISSNTSCTVITNSSVRFTFCITVTAHGHSWDISSRPRCQSGRTEGEDVALLLLAPVLFLSYFCLTLPPPPCFSQ